LIVARPRRRAVAVAALAAAGCCLLALGASAAAAAAPRAFFGVSPQAPLSDADFERMATAKVGTLRFELSWAGTDPTAAPGDYDWSRTDAIVGRAAAGGIQALPFVFSTPDWVAELDRFRCRRSCVSFAPRGRAALAAWEDFLGAAAARYGPGGAFWTLNPLLPQQPIRAWQLWNEQNSPTYFKPRPNVGAYARLVASGREAITEVDGGAEIVLGGMFGTPLGGLKPAIEASKFLARLYDRPGAKRSFDGVASHPYAAQFSKARAQVELLREQIEEAGDGQTELWITELGWASAGLTDPLNRGPQGQAERLKEAFRYFFKKRGMLNIRTVTWYSWRDNPDPAAGLCTWCPYSGLVTADLLDKPSLKVFTRFTNGS